MSHTAYYEQQEETTMSGKTTKITEVPEAVAQAAQANYEKTVSGVKEGVAVATANFQKSQDQFKVGMEKAVKTAEEFVSFGQGNLEAFVKSGQIFAAGVQDLGKHLAATAQHSFEHSVASMKAVASAKSVKEAIELQTAFARASMEKAVAETTKVTETSLKLIEQVSAPITARMSLAVEKFSKTA
jgi:phasin family protein